MKICQLVVLTLFVYCTADPLVRYQPEQIHLSLGGELKVFLTINKQMNSGNSIKIY